MKNNIFEEAINQLNKYNLKITNKDINRPWGGFFVIDEAHSQKFSNIYFDGLNSNKLKISGKLSPKILIIAPNKRLSWQYHNRRCEIWKVSKGEVKVVKS